MPEVHEVACPAFGPKTVMLGPHHIGLQYEYGWQDPRRMSQEELKSWWMRSMLDCARDQL